MNRGAEKVVKKPAGNVRLLYELSISIGGPGLLRAMLAESVDSFLQKLGCSAAWVYRLKGDIDGRFRYEMLHEAGAERACEEALSGVPKEMDGAGKDLFAGRLPFRKKGRSSHWFHFFELPGFGLFVLEKKGSAIRPSMVAALKPLMSKFASHCTACLTNDELERLYAKVLELNTEIMEKAADLEMSKSAMLHVLREMKETEEALKESEERYRTFFETSPVGLVISGPDFGFLRANDSFKEILGYTDEDLKDMTFREITHPDDLLSTQIAVRDIVEGRSDSFRLQKRYLRKDGSLCWGDVSVSGLRDAARGVFSWFATVTDITELKAAEESLKESRNKFERLSREFNTLLDAIPDSLLLLSPELKVLWANSGALEKLGKGNHEISGLHCYEVYGKDSPCKDCPALKSFETGEAVNTQLYRGGRFLDVRTFPIKDENGDLSSVIKVEIDITEKINLQEEAVRAAHLASIGELAAGVAHEINNPINAVINYAQMLCDGEGGNTEIASRIMKEGERIAGIVRSLLSFSRVRERSFETANMLEVVFDTLVLVEAQLRHDGIKLEVDVPSNLPVVTIDTQQMQQVFLNILNNSRYALNQKYPGAHEDKILGIRGHEELLDGVAHLILTFRDHGTGIPEDILEKVMAPFFTTKPGGKGTGLGLSISRNIANDHGGRLRIDSVEGEFTEVSVCLPVLRRDE